MLGKSVNLDVDFDFDFDVDVVVEVDSLDVEAIGDAGGKSECLSAT